MPTTIIVIKSAEERDQFMADAVAAGVELKPIEGLPRHFTAEGYGPGSFPLALHPSVELLELEQFNLKAVASQAVSLNQDMSGTGGWPAARVIRRDNPWKDLHQPSWPRASTFDCVRDGSGVDIYIIDSGVEYTHTEFGRRVTQCWHNSDSLATATLDGSGHGTHCLSVALGSTVGIARGAQGHSFKAHDSNSGMGNTNALNALGAVLAQYNLNAADNRPGVLFFSWSGFGSTINAAVTDLINAGVVCCFPAGNDLTDLGTVSLFPAESDADAIICGGINMADGPYYDGLFGTNWGNEVNILAPAQLTLGAQRVASGGGLRRGSGTSYATPIVAGVIACMLQTYNRLTTRAEVQALKTYLLANATTGKRRQTEKVPELPDAIVYLNPLLPHEDIPGLTPRVP